MEGKMEKTKCERQYNQLLECLDDFDRNWGKCQEELKTFRLCYNKGNENKTTEGNGKKNIP
ncbi:conserved Plasmodium protein, unknown function [Plasmodium ovale]|uniref:CHCH domain-containing protein n=1 Tax=Plasmodium ovale TaxID=36330 RepID=A0A1C3KMA6_PLAOA|nr:conserved Plasmodium protein, unknown function [Plasmodium ovale]